MTALLANPAAAPNALRVARTLLVVLHLPYVVVPITFVAADISQSGTGADRWWVAFVIAVAAGGLSLRHSLAVADGYRPRGWQVTLALLAALAIGGTVELGWNFQSILALATASVIMLAPFWAGAVAVATLVAVAVAVAWAVGQPTTAAAAIYWTAFPAVSAVGFSVALPLAATLVRTLVEVRRGQEELADQGVAAERSRVARDLHDLVGQTLTAVSLKGDLALRLLPERPVSARAEIAGATDLARHALHAVRGVARHRPAVSLHAEVTNAQALLAAAGLRANIDVPEHDLSAPIEEVLAWAVREGTTNVLRHSTATNVRIVLTVDRSLARLTLGNDGVFQPAGPRSGLNGLADRALTVGGRLDTAEANGEFVLTLQLPRRLS